MISIGRLEARDRTVWGELFAGYQVFHGRPDRQQDDYGKAWRRLARDEQIRARAIDELDRGRGPNL